MKLISILRNNSQSPPWIFINYIQQREDDDVNSSSAPATIANDNDNNNIIDDEMMSEEKFLNETKTDNKYNVDGRNKEKKKKQLIVSGRDDVLLKLLADKMNFKFEYIDVKMMELNENVTVAGALGLQMLQRRVTCLLIVHDLNSVN